MQRFHRPANLPCVAAARKLCALDARKTFWVASYPKSGSTWLRLLAANVRAADAGPVDINDIPGEGSIASDRAAFDDIMLVDSGLLTFDEIDELRPRLHETVALSGGEDDEDAHADAGAVRFVKVHDAYTLTARREPLLGGRRAADGALVIVRDPRDVACSLADYRRTAFGAAVRRLADPQAATANDPRGQSHQLRQRLLGWSDHVASWIDQKDIPAHLIRYEDLHRDTAGVLSRALEFAGISATSAQIEQAAVFASFSSLQRQEREHGFGEAPQFNGRGLFFRRGEVGAWRDELDEASIRSIERTHGPMMRRLGYVFAAHLSRQGGATTTELPS